ncbi:MAG TPA: M28 family peptidase [Candidatus Acidoferrales bacterium]|nr:M28 family peptidase [Candidatus Acidoferrales bacterium]
MNSITMRFSILSLGAAVLLGAGCNASSGGGTHASDSKPRAGAVAASPTLQAAQAVDAPPPEKTGGFDGRKAFAHVARLTQMGARQSGTPGILPAQQYILSELKSYGCTVETDDFHADTPAGSLAMKNILAKIPGERPDVVLFAGHYDTKRLENFVGADDGGSSTAVMLELARVLCGKRGRDTVWVAFFDGEEAVRPEWKDPDNCYGSRQLAARLAISGELKRIKAMLLADIVGYKELRLRRDSSSTEWLTDVVWSVADKLGYSNVFVGEENPIGGDDHLPFIRRGVAATDVIDFEIPYWHTPQDTLDKISARSLAVVGHVLLESLPELARRPR